MANYTKFKNANGDDLIVIPNTSTATDGDVLSYKDEEIKWAPAGGGTSIEAGTDLVLDNGILKVNTNGSITNLANMEFVAGTGTSANGIGAAAFGKSTTSFGYGAFAAGNNSIASGDGTHTEGYMTSAVKSYSHAEGYQTLASGMQSHAEGGSTKAFETGSHAEGSNTRASGQYSHAEGGNTTAFGNYSHAEGQSTYASGSISHAEGQYTSAIDMIAHSQGYYTIAKSKIGTYAPETPMFACGICNATSADVLFVVGNGSRTLQSSQWVEKRSDAFVIDQTGLASAVNLATSGFADVDAALTTLSSDIGNIETILQSI